MAGRSTQDLTGQRLGHFRVDGVIGRGGMSVLYRATDTRLNRPVAIKIFGPGNDPTADQRFQQEAQVMANLHHPGLVGVHDFAVEPHRAYLVMELVDGPTLREVIENEQLPADEIRRIGLDVAQTLDYVHGQGITHRDVKPSNILIGSDGRARLADFGVASLLGADGHTAAGEIIGTTSGRPRTSTRSAWCCWRRGPGARSTRATASRGPPSGSTARPSCRATCRSRCAARSPR